MDTDNPPDHSASTHEHHDHGTETGSAHGASAELAMNVVEAEACLIANHGVVATGDTVADAVETAQAIESVARIYCQTKMLDEDPDLLPHPELNHAARKLSSDGGL